MSSQPPSPRCPRCSRPLAAWKLQHCVYCGESFPPDFKEGYTAPEALKWVERPAIPPDAARQLEMMKVMPWDRRKKPRRVLLFAAGFSLAAFTVVFSLLYRLLQRYVPSFGLLVLAVGLGFLGYLGWMFWKAYRRGES